MSPFEERVLKNQIEIMWTLNLLLGKLVPDLVGRGGELDHMRADLGTACRDSRDLLERART